MTRPYRTHSNKRTRLRLVEEADAEFILQLRLDPRISRHISKVENDLGKQIDWIREYMKREAKGKDYYFIVEDLNGKRYGTCRTYDIDYDRSEARVGSWVMSPEAPYYMAFDALLIGYRFVFWDLGVETILLDVRKANRESVRSVEVKLGAIWTGEDELNDYFKLPRDVFAHALETRLKRYMDRYF